MQRPSPIGRGSPAMSSSILSSEEERPNLAEGLDMARMAQEAPRGLQAVLMSHAVVAAAAGSSAAGSSIQTPRMELVPRWTLRREGALRPVPAFYPPLDPNGSTLVTDAPPSVVALRISHLLGSLGLSVEFDEEAATALVWTADRVMASIHLYRGASSLSSSSSSFGTTETRRNSTDWSHAVVVEVVRIRGSVVSFHGQVCRPILRAARGDAALLTHAPKLQIAHAARSSPYGFGRLEQLPLGRADLARTLTTANNDHLKSKEDQKNVVWEALEGALILIQKDRWDAQLLGMERVVALLDASLFQTKVAAQMASLSILGVVQVPPPLEQITHVLTNLLLHRRSLFHPPPHRNNQHGNSKKKRHSVSNNQNRNSSNHHHHGIHGRQQQQQHRSGNPSVTRSKHQGGPNGEGQNVQVNTNNDEDEGDVVWSMGEMAHMSALRSLALRALSRALPLVQSTRAWRTVISEHEDVVWTGLALAMALKQDLAGASRPPSSLSSQQQHATSIHDAALAATCLGQLLGMTFLTPCKRAIDKEPHYCQEILQDLERAAHIGSSSHPVLHKAAKTAYERILLASQQQKQQ